MQHVCIRGLPPNDPSVFYCGRPTGKWHGSPLGNPCSMPTEACPVCGQVHYLTGMQRLSDSKPCYKIWLKRQMFAGRLLDVLRSIPADARLGCWCRDARECHVNVVIEAARWAHDNPEYQGGKIECST